MKVLKVGVFLKGKRDERTTMRRARRDVSSLKSSLVVSSLLLLLLMCLIVVLQQKHVKVLTWLIICATPARDTGIRSYFSIFTFYTACSERFETRASRVLRATVWFLPQNRRRPRWVRNRRFLLLREMVAVRCQGTTTFLASRRRRLWRRVCFALANRI